MEFFRASFFAVAALAISPAAVRAGTVPEAPLLSHAGDSLQVQVASGETRSVMIAADAGEFIRVIAQADSGLAVKTTLFDAAGKVVDAAPGLGGTGGQATVAAATESGGEFRLDVQSQMFRPEKRTCTVRLEVRRPATAEDLADARAHRAFVTAATLPGAASAAHDRAVAAALDDPLRLARQAHDSLLEARALFGKGQFLAMAGDFRAALPWFERAAPVIRGLNDPRAEAHLLSVMALVYTNLEEHARAIELYRQALPLEKAAGQEWESALTLNNLADSESALGRVDLALDYLREEKALRTALDDELGLNQTLVGMASRYLEMGDSENALEALIATLPHWPHLHDAEFEAQTWKQLGETYTRLGEYASAAAALDKAGRVVNEQEMPRTAGEILIARARLQRITGSTRAALATSEDALRLMQRADYRHGQVLALLEISDLLESENRISEARERLRTALPIATGLGLLYDEACVRRELGTLDGARAELEAALAIDRDIGDRFGEVLSLTALAKLAHQQGSTRDAIEDLARARKLVESARSSLLDPGLRASWLASQRDLYEFSATLLEQEAARTRSREYTIQAFEVSEQAHARVLLDTVADRADSRGIDPKLCSEERALAASIHAKTLTATAKEKPALTGLMLQHKVIDLRLHEVGGLAAVHGARTVASLADLRRDALGPDTALLEYLVGAQHSHLWVLTRSDLRHYELPGGEALSTAVSRLYSAVTARNRVHGGDFDGADREAFAAASALGRMLLPPGALTANFRTMVIAPDGPLQYVPFSALPMIRGKEVVLTPSASVLAEIRRAHSFRSWGRALVLADPVYTVEDPRVAAVRAPARAAPPTEFAVLAPVLRSARDAGVHDFARLPMSRIEAEQIAQLAGPASTRTLLDFDASLRSFRRFDSGKYGIIHIAAHTLVDADRPDLSGVVLSLVDRSGRPQDGFLRLGDIYNLHLNAGLVTLSACQSSLGRDVTGEGMLGLSRGFLSAGASRVLATLWSVEDRATTVFMERFYRALLDDHLSAPAALTRAQAEMKADPHWASPYYWAAFTLSGDWQ
ncbi:MAG TPA: CHAT domain-containing tetratricopeptide repeat protein [Bryobacteraceae bacterium]|nr:CHAT domain-containing tetratricopeptide repeat protein [Bryobacteraceae bacterium]